MTFRLTCLHLSLAASLANHSPDKGRKVSSLHTVTVTSYPATCAPHVHPFTCVSICLLWIMQFSVCVSICARRLVWACIKLLFTRPPHLCMKCFCSEWENTTKLWHSNDGWWVVDAKWECLTLGARRLWENTHPCCFPWGKVSVNKGEHLFMFY